MRSRAPIVAFIICAGMLLAGPAALSGQRAGGVPTPVPEGVRTRPLPDGTPLLTDDKGMTLYTFARDTSSQSNCNDACAVQWPPLAAAPLWTVITRTDGSKQWAYRGRPLYRWIKDGKPGDITGEGFAGGAWKLAVVDRPADLVRVYLAHVTTTFRDAPKTQGLLPTAVAEAKIAASHAAMASKSPDNLEAMKLHAGHVINAIDPAIEPNGPGLGFGVRRAAAGIVEQVQLAARVPNASQEVLTFASRVVASSNNTLARSSEMVRIAQCIRGAATAAEARTELAQLTVLARELTEGLDSNKDGEIGWQTGEGGLEQAAAQVNLMLGR
jgi:predicted lipoprotein with Yx(FWY)xxD motif